MFQRFVISLTLHLIAILAFAQSSNGFLHMELYNADNGLSQSTVNVVFQDSHGFLWVGTNDGLNKYDGYGFRVFQNNPLDTNSIVHNIVTSLSEDVHGNLWVGTRRGLGVYDRQSGKFRNFVHNPADISSLSSNSILALMEDSNGDIWVKTPESLDRYCNQSGTFIRYPHFSTPFTTSLAASHRMLLEDKNGTIWAGSKDGLLKFDRNLGLFRRFYHISDNPGTISSNNVTGIHIDTANNLWVATSNGLNRLSGSVAKFERYVNPNPSNNELSTLYTDREGTMYLGTPTGIAIFDPQLGRITETPNIYANGMRLPPVRVTSFFEDRSNILWIATNKGLLKWDRKPHKFILYSKNPNGNNLFYNNNITSVAEYQGRLWVGTDGGGIFQYRETDGATVSYSSLQNRWIGSNTIGAIYITPANELIVGTKSGVYKYLPREERFVDYFRSKGLNIRNPFVDNAVHALKYDSLGNLWVGTQQGLYRFDGKGVLPASDFISGQPLLSSEITSIETDSQGLLWVGTPDGLLQINPFEPTALLFQKQSHRVSKGMVSNSILSLLVDSQGRLWVGTESGLHRLDPKSSSFILYTQQQGLPNNIIYSIEEDRDGNIWVSTNRGIAQLNVQTNAILSYTPSDGLQGFVFNRGASFKSPSNKLYFGGVAGLNAFNPVDIHLNKTVPSIAITSFEVYGPKGLEVIPLSGITNQRIVLQDFNLINIEFAALDFTQPSRNQFKYMMEGLDNEWFEIGTKRSATFSHLSEGVYRFRVIGSNSDNIWNYEGTSLTIVVETKFWKTRKAFVLYAILLVVFIFLFLRARTRILRRTNRLLHEREETMFEMQAQKEELMVKNKSITDSITYAKRIQEAIMPSESHFKRIIPDSFILYMPKDIVSGDFYWINETESKIFVAVIDCTGHGVPGAFMSIIGVELLRNITHTMGVLDAAQILNELNEGVISVFGVSTDNTHLTVKDGMDVSFCILDKQEGTLQYAGAFTCIYIVRENKIIEVKGDRFSVGMGSESIDTPFKNHLINVQPEDMVYMFTDGYIDQFGGSEGKKYKFRRFRHLLLNIHKYPLDVQRKLLHDSIIEWKGVHEQVDDILIIGIMPMGARGQ